MNNIDPINGNWRLVERTPLKTVYWLDNGDGTYTQRTDYHSEAIIEDNKRLSIDTQNEKFGDGKIIARVPMNIAFGNHYFAEALSNKDENAMSKWLNDSDNAHWRTFHGKV